MSNRGVRPIVCGADGQPIPGAAVALYQIVQLGTTDKDGGVTFELDEAQTDICVKVLNVPGYQTYLQSPLIPAHNVNLGIGTPVGPTDVQLPPLNPPSPPHAVVDVRAGFCNLHDSRVIAPSLRGRPIFSPYFICLSEAEQDEWIQIWLNAKMTHVVIMTINPVYPEGLPQYGGAQYPAPSFDPTPAQFAAGLGKLIMHGFTPIAFCTNGAYPTDLAAFEAMLVAFVQPFKDKVIAVEGWEPYWTNQQHQDLYAIMRRVLGPDAKLGLHLPSNYIHNGGGTSDWLTCFAEVDVFLMELAPASNMAEAASMEAGWQQCICRVLLGTGCPFYLGGRVRTVAVFEQVAYYQIREDITDADIDSIMSWDLSQGILWLGNANGF